MNRKEILARIEEELAESCRVKQQFSEELKAQIIELAQRIQEAHITIGHIVCGIVEDMLAPS